MSTLHRPVIIDNGTGRAACQPFDTNATHQEIYEFWDSSMMRLFREAGLPWRPQQGGWHTITVVDDKSRSASRDVKIEILP